MLVFISYFVTNVFTKIIECDIITLEYRLNLIDSRMISGITQEQINTMNIPHNHTYFEHLTLAGLTSQQALVYESLLRGGARAASKVANDTHLERVIAYRVLDQLLEMGLVNKKDDPGKVARFEAAHPSRIQELIEQREKDARTAKESFASVLSSLSSEYSLSVGKPSVQFFEGLEGIRTVAFDNLTARGEILAYLDMSVIQAHLKDLNDEYVKVRRRLKIKKRNLVNDTPENRVYLADYHRDITDIRLVDRAHSPMQFKSMLQIYDNKISYMTFEKNKYIGVIIEDAHIAELHRQLYEFTWEKARAL